MRDGKEFKLTQDEYVVLKEASLTGISTVFFERICINLPDMAYAEEKKEIVENMPVLPEFTQEEHDRAQIKLNEIRGRLKKKLFN